MNLRVSQLQKNVKAGQYVFGWNRLRVALLVANAFTPSTAMTLPTQLLGVSDYFSRGKYTDPNLNTALSQLSIAVD